ncbi:porin [Lunatibacter salilacus]|uniref:porin n=1 Tax=Lunatibacter salilacus TaxID=2483804 RepID=UPI001F488DC1|nr:porin [Lunatibacter salilacus]
MTVPSVPLNNFTKPNSMLGFAFPSFQLTPLATIRYFLEVKTNLLIVGLIMFSLSLKAQETVDKLQVSGYMEAYYSFDVSRPVSHERPSFLYNFKRHNEFSFNLALVQLAYNSGKTRANVGAMAGTYAQYNLADEPVWAQFVYEASVGVQLIEQLWLDVGIMPSHIGFESAVGMDCWHLSRSLLAENSPYFLTGARLTYAINNKLEATLWVTNGWQNVQRTRGHELPSLGLGVQYKPTDDLILNYANYWGNESPHPINMYRFFNNFYVQKYSDLVNMTIGADFGLEQRVFRQGFNYWYGVTLSLQKPLSDKFTLAGRAEYYSDTKGVILADAMQVSGLSLNLDYNLTEKAVIRVEGRQFISPEPIFQQTSGWMNRGNLAINTSLAVRF